MAGHLWWLSDQFRTKQLEDMLWCDTKDTRADPKTVGLSLRTVNSVVNIIRVYVLKS